MSESKDNKCIFVTEQYIKELEKKAKDTEYFRGRIDGLEYVIDTIENILKSKGEE